MLLHWCWGLELRSSCLYTKHSFLLNHALLQLRGQHFLEGKDPLKRVLGPVSYAAQSLRGKRTVCPATLWSTHSLLFLTCPIIWLFDLLIAQWVLGGWVWCLAHLSVTGLGHRVNQGLWKKHSLRDSWFYFNCSWFGVTYFHGKSGSLLLVLHRIACHLNVVVNWSPWQYVFPKFPFKYGKARYHWGHRTTLMSILATACPTLCPCLWLWFFSLYALLLEFSLFLVPSGSLTPQVLLVIADRGRI